VGDTLPETGTAATRIDRPSHTHVVPEPSATLTPEEAIRHDELHRVRMFTVFLAAMCGVGGGIIAMLGGDPRARLIHLIAVLSTGIVATAYAVFVTTARFRPIHLLGLVTIASLTNITGYYYWGYLSGYIAVVTVAAYLVSTAGLRGVVGIGIVLSVGGHLAIGFATIAGVLEDRGLLSSSHLAIFDRTSTLLLLNGVVLGASVLGMQTHAVTRRVLATSLDAFRDLARREAQLAEAREEARDAMAAGGRLQGQMIGRFRLGELIGRGAMGEVYGAESDDGPCAVKLLAPHLREDADALKRFHREARAAAALASPHIVRIIEVSPPEATLPYLAMERLDGVDLATAVKDRPIRPLSEVVDIMEQIAAGLDVAHAAGIVHRDLKLQNIFGVGPTAGRTWKLLDFGVAKLVAGGATVTHDQQIVGTPGYMAPEQARGGKVDARTDVYALGVVAYRLLTGLPAVVPGELPAMLYEIVHRMPPRPSSLVDVAPSVESVLAIALAKSPDRRFASAGEFARALSEAAAGRADPEIAARAGAILARAPWGHWARQRRSTTAAI